MRDIKEIRRLASEGQLTPEMAQMEARMRRSLIRMLRGNGKAGVSRLIYEIREIESLG